MKNNDVLENAEALFKTLTVLQKYLEFNGSISSESKQRERFQLAYT